MAVCQEVASQASLSGTRLGRPCQPGLGQDGLDDTRGVGQDALKLADLFVQTNNGLMSTNRHELAIPFDERSTASRSFAIVARRNRRTNRRLVRKESKPQLSAVGVPQRKPVSKSHTLPRSAGSTSTPRRVARAKPDHSDAPSQLRQSNRTQIPEILADSTQPVRRNARPRHFEALRR